MTKIIIVGANGRMGIKVREVCSSLNDVQAVCGIDLVENLDNANFPIYSSFDCIKEKADAIIDFSSPKSLDRVLDYALKTKTSVVLCPTGYTPEQIEKINTASKEIGVFRSANMSLGVNVLLGIVAEVAKKLYGFDIEIIEKHHNNKIDAPSGTALMFADEIKKAMPEKFYTYGREGIVGKRDENEIGIHAIRGGTIVGEHDVIFAGNNETISLSHTATDRTVFAVGAVRAGLFMANKTCGLFNMSDVLKNA